jgi:hypothetical protein
MSFFRNTLFYTFRSPFLLTVLFFGITLISFTPIYDEVDDVSMVRMASGHYSGPPSSLLVYINPLYGVLLAKLYTLSPYVPWYALLFLGFLFLAFYLNAKFIYSFAGNRWLLNILAIAYIIPFYFQSIVFLQYTYVASIIAYTAFLLIYKEVSKQEKLSWFPFVIGIVLLLLAFIIRENAFLYMATLAVPVGIFSFFKTRNKTNKYVLISGVFLLFIFILGSKVYSSYAYSKSEDWKTYMKWSAVQAYYHEYNVASYEKNKEIYEEVGWSENDYSMFYYWFYTDEERFSTEDVASIIAGAKQKNISQEGFDFTIQFFLMQLSYHSSAVILLLWFFGILAVYVFEKRSVFFYCVSTLAVGIGLIFYFSFLGRILPVRFVYPLFLAIGMYLFFLICSIDLSPSKRIPRLFVAIFLLFAFSHGTLLLLHAQQNKTKVSQFSQILQKIPQNNLVFNWDSSVPIHWISVFDSLEVFNNRDIAGTGWPQRSPYDKALLKKYDVDDLYVDSIDNPHVYLIATPEYLTLLTLYLKEHYNKEIRIEYHEDFTAYDIYPRYGYGAHLVTLKSYENLSK